ncbi:hypothetical protein BH23GEM7_BH23GEM7_39880 [soil metagenome]|jgi:hypothetical protein
MIDERFAIERPLSGSLRLATSPPILGERLVGPDTISQIRAFLLLKFSPPPNSGEGPGEGAYGS